MSQVLRLNGVPDSAYIEWAVGGGPTELYVSMEVYIDAAFVAAMGAASGPCTSYAVGSIDNGNNDIHLVSNACTGSDYDGVKDDFFSLQTSVAAFSSGWHTIQWSYAPGGTQHQSIDAADQTRSQSGFPFGLTSVQFGMYFRSAGVMWIGACKIGSSYGAADVLDYDPRTDGDPAVFGFSTVYGDVTLVDDPAGGGGGGGGGSFADDTATDGGAGGVRIAVAFNDTTFEPDPTWTFLTALESVRAASYSLDKGKQDEQDQVGTTQVVINVFDRNGTLDPTNSSSLYYGLIDALLQVRIELYNPVTATWHTRFRGFIRDLDYVPYPGSHVDPAGVVEGYYSLQISCVGIMEPITAIELQLGAFGDTPPAGTEGFVFFDNATFQDRITQVWGNAGIDAGWLVAFTGNVEMAESRYSPSDNVMSVIQDAVDAELPTVANAYEDRFGRLAAHGRLAEFDAPAVAAGASAGAWDFHEWKAGDERAVLASPSDTAQIREAPFNRGNGHLVNSAYCTPAGIAEGDKPGQLSTDPTSIAKYGIRSWSKENLFISEGLLTGLSAKDETKLYADFLVANFKQPKNRFTRLTFKSMRPEDERAAPNWDLLCRCDVQDSIEVTITFAGRPADSPNFNAEPFFILGIHEQVTPLTASYAMVTTSLDVAPRPLDPLILATPG